MEILISTSKLPPVKALVLDFDGTVSTLRHGWEQVMEPLMAEMICGSTPLTPALKKEIADYINESTGIQTIHQMKWLANAVQEKGLNPGMPTDPWFYKAEYNRRLMRKVRDRLDALNSAKESPESYLMAGSRAFLESLVNRGVKLYVASGTDHPDVVNEATALGVAPLFTEIAGAPVGAESCSKEAVIRRLLEQQGLPGEDLAVIGDGKVEIMLGRQFGARTLGLASNETDRRGIDPVKRQRLINAGAHVITGDYLEPEAILEFLGF